MKIQKKRVTRRLAFIIIFTSILIVLGCIFQVNNELQALFGDSRDNYPDTGEYQLNSDEFLLMKLDTGAVIAGKEKDKSIYPASLTKIMTAILALEKLADLDQEILLPEDIFPALISQNASQAGFSPGELATARDLIYGAMLPSGAECCLGLADQIAGSEAAFVELMNQKADELGMYNTHFTNTTGLHQKDHYSTVKDIAVLLQYALQNNDFRVIFTSRRHSTSGTNLHPDGFTFGSTLFKYNDDLNIAGGEVLGGKTGYTSEAGQCLASLANVAGDDYILVTAGAAKKSGEEQLHIQDACHVYSVLGAALAADGS